MTRRYEMMVIIDSGQSDEEIEAQIAKIEEAISSSSGGEIISTDKWGKKRLAYEIKSKQFGYYVVWEFQAEPELLAELDRNLRFDTNILRHMILHISPKVIKLKEQEQELKVHLEERRRRLAEEADEQPVVDLISNENGDSEGSGDVTPSAAGQDAMENAEEKAGAETEAEPKAEAEAESDASGEQE